MIISVTKKDITKAFSARGTEGYADNYQCPIAQSIRRRFPFVNDIKVASGIITVGFKTVTTPPEAERFIENFDEEQLVFPFRFNLDLK